MYKKWKKILIVFALIICMSSSRFAAIVSDNDGSAFVTKSEFEALKSDFNSQIDNYNLSIDRKIDGAIGQYLAGLNLAKKEVLPTKYYDYKIDGNDLGWYGKTTGANINLNTNYYLVNNIEASIRMYRYSATDSKFLYKRYKGTGVWWPGSTTSHAQTDINVRTDVDAVYNNYIICDTDDNILYFAYCATKQTSMYYNYNMAAADQPDPIYNIDTIKGGDSWYASGLRAPRWITERASTDIASKYFTALCPMSTTAYNRVNYGANKWVSFRHIGGRNTRDMLKTTKEAETLSGELCPLYNIPRIYLPEGRPKNAYDESDKKSLNEYGYANLVKVSPLNGAIKYGVYLTTTTRKGIAIISFVPTESGTVYIRTGTGDSSTSTLKETKAVTGGKNEKIEVKDVPKNTNIFFIYAPAGDDVGYINSLVVQQQDDD